MRACLKTGGLGTRALLCRGETGPTHCHTHSGDLSSEDSETTILREWHGEKRAKKREFQRVCNRMRERETLHSKRAKKRECRRKAGRLREVLKARER